MQSDAKVDRYPDERGRARRVFVVYGRDEQVRVRIFEFLRSLDLHPLEWEHLVAATGETTPYLPEVIARGLPHGQAVVALLTPDDIVVLHTDLQNAADPLHKRVPAGQARPNVLLELGMAMALFPERTIILEIGSMRPIADLGGRNVIRFNGSAESVGKLVERLKDAGCQVNDRGSDWRNPDRFAGLAAYTRQSDHSSITAAAATASTEVGPVATPAQPAPASPVDQGGRGHVTTIKGRTNVNKLHIGDNYSRERP